MKYLLSIVNGFIVGILVAICILYVFKIKTPYPAWLLKTFEKPWILLLLFILGVIFLNYNKEAGALIIIISIALFIDRFLFARPLNMDTSDKPKTKKAPISNKEIPKNSSTIDPEMEDHGVTLLPLTNTPPGSVPPSSGMYLPLDEIYANERGLTTYKDKLLIQSNKFHENLSPDFGSNYILTNDDYASVSDH